MSKLFLAPLLVWPLLARRFRALGFASLATCALLAAGFIFGPIGPAAYAQLLSQLGSHEARAGFGVIGALMHRRAHPRTARSCSRSPRPLACWAWHTFVPDGPARNRVLFAAAIVAALICSPVVWSHYLVLLSAALIALRPSRRVFVLLALASWAIAPPHGIHLDTEIFGSVASHGALLALATCVGVVAVAARPRRGRLD